MVSTVTEWNRAVDLVRALALLSIACLSFLPDPAVAETAYSRLSQNNWLVEVKTNESVASPKPAGEPIIADETAPAISGNGQLAFERSGSLHVCLTSSEVCKEVEGTEESARPAWNPTSDELVFTRFAFLDGVEDSDLWTVNLESSSPRPLVIQEGLQDDPDFSSDGRYLAYTTGQQVKLSGMSSHVVRQVWVLDLETGAAGPVTRGPWIDLHPDWAPDGERLAFASNRTGRFEIWVVDLDGDGARRITSGDGVKTWPAWSPDGKEILFTRILDGKYSLWITHLDGEELREFRPQGVGPEVQMRDGDWR